MRETGFGIARAIELLREGCLIARDGWFGNLPNDGALWILLVPADEKKRRREYIEARTRDGVFAPFIASSDDLFANDWYVVKCT